MRSCRTPARLALRALLLGKLHGPRAHGAASYLSNQMPRTYAAKPAYAVRFWSTRGMRPPAVDVLDLVERKAAHYFSEALPTVPGFVLCGDSRAVDLGALVPPATTIITSPPYYGMRTYVPDQWIRHWFLGGPSTVEYSFPGQLDHASP